MLCSSRLRGEGGGLAELAVLKLQAMKLSMPSASMVPDAKIISGDPRWKEIHSPISMDPVS